MNTGQMLITIGAVFLLSLVILRVTSTLLSTSDIIDRSKIGLLAISYATTVVEEANSKRFDGNITAGALSDTSQLSTTLGPESGESYRQFNDFDDYNFFRYSPKLDTVYVTQTDSIVFQTYCSINYVTDSNPNVSTKARTWHKKLTVKITSETMLDDYSNKQDTVEMSTIFSYWFF